MILSKIRITIDAKSNKISKITSIADGIEIEKANIIKKFPRNTFVMPGFVDSHIHFFGVGEVSLMPNLSDCCSEDDLIDKIKSSSFRRGDWIVGFGWNQENFRNKQYPHKSTLDKAFPNAPVYLKRIDGHSALINSFADKIIGINNKTPNPPGGIIQRDENNDLSGILIDNAIELVQSKLPFYSPTQIQEITKISESILTKMGITEVYDMDFYPDLYDYFLLNGNKFKLRINSFVKSQNDEWKGICKVPLKKKMWKLIGFKYYLDGALGSRGASLLEKYNDAETYGLDLLSNEVILEKTREALNQNLSIAVHAIGDKANRIALQTFSLFQRHKNKLRIEHCQIIREKDLKYLRNGNIICSVQPIHFVSDTLSNMAVERIGKYRMQDAYRWRSLIDAGATLVAGSDAPIESANPFFGLEAFVSSNNKKELLSLNEALDSYISNPHKIYKQKRGKIEVGYDADFIIIDNNFMENPKSISKTNVLSTIINGNFVTNNGQ